MGDVKGPIVAVAAALFASAFGVPAPAAADSPVDPAAAVQNVKQSADTNTAAATAPAVQQGTSVAQGAAGTAPAPTIRKTIERIANRTPAARRQSGDPIRPAAPTRLPAAPTAAPTRGQPIVRDSLRTSRDRHATPTTGMRAAKTSFPPQGWKATPPARSVPERAVGFRTAPQRTAPTPAPDGFPDGAGATIGAGGLTAPNAMSFVALLIVALAVSGTLQLRPLRIRAPARRRLVFVTPAVPPG